MESYFFVFFCKTICIRFSCKSREAFEVTVCLLFQISVWINPKWKRVSRRLQSSPKRWGINHSPSPFGRPAPIRKVFPPQSSQTSYWFSMPWSIPGCDATWSVSALQGSVLMLRCILICAQCRGRVKLCASFFSSNSACPASPQTAFFTFPICILRKSFFIWDCWALNEVDELSTL